MEKVSRMSGLLLGAFRGLPSALCLLLTAYCLLPSVLHAQGCAMCYTSASAARSGAKEALANGVLILLVPPMVFFAVITVVVYLYRNKFRESSVVTRSGDRVIGKSGEQSRWEPYLFDHPISGSTDQPIHPKGQGN